MRYENEQEPKGLFTFYKEQAQQQQSRNIFKKKKKSKPKKSKKNHEHKIIQHISSPIKTGSQELIQSKQFNLPQRFLKNILGKQRGQDHSALTNQSKSARLKTQPFQKSPQQKQVANFVLSKIDEERSKNVHKIASIQKQKRDFQFQKYLAKANNKIHLIQCKMKEEDMFQSPRVYEGIHIPKAEVKKINENEVGDRFLKNENKSFLEKLKHLESKSRSNLISNRESARDSAKGDLHDQNKKYFHQLISNFYKNSSAQNNSAYKILKSSLKFPNIVQTRVVRIKTEEALPIRSSQKLMGPLRSSSFYRKDLPKKSKRSNQKYTELYKLNVINELKQSISSKDTKAINFIDMSKDYNLQRQESEERKIKKRMVKSRLGVQL